jgi:hypothetical protein
MNWLGGRDSNPDTVVQRAVHVLWCVSVRSGLFPFPRSALRFAPVSSGVFVCRVSHRVSGDGLKRGHTPSSQIREKLQQPTGFIWIVWAHDFVDRLRGDWSVSPSRGDGWNRDTSVAAIPEAVDRRSRLLHREATRRYLRRTPAGAMPFAGQPAPPALVVYHLRDRPGSSGGASDAAESIAQAYLRGAPR